MTYPGEALERAVKRYGPFSEQAKEAAIRMCQVAGLDPHFKYATQPRVSPVPLSSDDLTPAPYSYEEEWQRLVAAVARS
jgi:hypothetical protein